MQILINIKCEIDVCSFLTSSSTKIAKKDLVIRFILVMMSGAEVLNFRRRGTIKFHSIFGKLLHF